MSCIIVYLYAYFSLYLHLIDLGILWLFHSITSTWIESQISNLLLPIEVIVTKIFVLTSYDSGPMRFEWGIKVLTVNREVKTKLKRDCCVLISHYLCDNAIGIRQLKISSLKIFRYYFMVVQALGLFCQYYNWNTRRWALNNKL